jgi:archaeoflavoprotein AfpA
VKKVRMAWGITGAGDYLVESLEVMKRISSDFDVEVTVLVSKNAEMVIKWYRLWDDLTSSLEKVKVERGANVPFIAGPLQIGYYGLFFISPATANTVAKIAYGMADTLITNCVAQAIKGGTPVYIYPVDQELGSRETQVPEGDVITIRTRRVDVENVERIRNMEGITVLKHPFEIEPIIAAIASRTTNFLEEE